LPGECVIEPGAGLLLLSSPLLAGCPRRATRGNVLPVVNLWRSTEVGEVPRRSAPRRTVRAVGTPVERRDDRRAGPPPCVLCTVGCNIGNI